MKSKQQRLQNVLAQRGYASRRSAADLVRAGRVSVNGITVKEPGVRVDSARDRILLDNRPVPVEPPPLQTLALNKPAGIICSADNRQGQTVCDLVRSCGQRLVPAGRLDKQSEGLVILSNDGDLIHRLTHPRHGHRKTYRVTVTGAVPRSALPALRRPIVVEGYRTHPADVRVVRSTTAQTVLTFQLTEGRNRQIRRLCDRAGLQIERLVRTAIGDFTIDRMPTGTWRVLDATDIQRLFAANAES